MLSRSPVNTLTQVTDLRGLMRVCLSEFSLILDNDVLIKARKLSCIDRAGELGHILNTEQLITTADPLDMTRPVKCR